MLEPLPSCTSSQSKDCSPKLVGYSRCNLQQRSAEVWTSPKRPKQITGHYVTQVLPPVTMYVEFMKLEHSVAAFVKIGIVVPTVGFKMVKSGRALCPPSRIPISCGPRLPVRIGPCAERIGGP